jgi:response regulator NasT
MISKAIAEQTCIATTGGEARQLLAERSFDLVVINAPLADESGIDLACAIVSNSITQVLLVENNEYFETVSPRCEANGVLVVARPIDKTHFRSALTFAKATHDKMKHLHTDKVLLKQKIEDIKIIDRAKCLLISYMGMSELEAHRAIEKQAMDLRATKRVIAEDILKTYEN